MALTRVSGGILKQPIDVGIITATSLNASGIITAGTVQVGSATTIHTTGIDLGSGNVTSHNINSTGIITATGFVGPVTGNVTGNASGTAGGLTGSPSISVTNITASGNVSIAGTLTYEDVTNIDSVGLITARSGIKVLTGTATTALLVEGNARVTGGLVMTGIATIGDVTVIGSPGQNSCVFGHQSLEDVTIGSHNAIFGLFAGKEITSGGDNTALGNYALRDNQTGENNVAVGKNALLNTTGDDNVGVGENALNRNESGTNNTVIGYKAGYYIEGSNNTILGAYQGVASDSALNNTVIISAGTSERIRVDSNGNVGIGTTIPDTMLSLHGTTQTQQLITLSSGSVKRNNYIGVNNSDNLVLSADEDNEGNDSAIRFRVDGVNRISITSAGDITASNTEFTTHVHQEYTGFYASSNTVNYLLVCPTTNTNIRFVGTIMTGRIDGTSGVGGGMIDVALIGSSTGDATKVDYTIRSMSTRGSSYVGPQGQWCTIDFGGTTYFAIRFSSSVTTMWGTAPQHCSFNGVINNCTPVGKNTQQDTLANETILTDARGRHTFQNTYVGINKRNPAQALDVVGRIKKTEYEPGEIIEQIASFCDGSSHTVKSGTYTMTNVTAEQTGSTSDATASGSTISYTPPLGTKRIHYQYWFKWEATERSGITHFFIQVDGNDVVVSRRTFATNLGMNSANTSYFHHGERWCCMNAVLECDASSTDTSEGQYAGWAANQETKDIRVRFREYNSSYEISLHGNNYWDAATASGTNQAPIKPMLIVTAIA